MNEFQERLQDLLFEHNLSRLQLAKKIGISFETLNGYFNKGFYPELSVAIKISNYFNCSLNYLLGLSEEPTINDIYSLSFQDTLKNLLKMHKLSSEKLMYALNMSPANYYRWQKGTTKPAVNSLIAISKFFDVSVDYLVGNQN